MASEHTAKFNQTQRELGLDMLCVWIPAGTKDSVQDMADRLRLDHLSSLVASGNGVAIEAMSAKRKINVIAISSYEDFVLGHPRALQGGSMYKTAKARYVAYRGAVEDYLRLAGEADTLRKLKPHSVEWKDPAARAYIASQHIKRIEADMRWQIAADQTHGN